jgi:hypothetical protein
LIPIRFQNLPIEYIKYFIQNPFEIMGYWLLHPWISIGFGLAFFQRIFSSTVKDFATDTPYLEIGYNETKTIHIGKMNLEIINNSDFEKVTLQSFMKSKSFTFIVDQYPGGIDESWRIYFNPPVIILNEPGQNISYNVSVEISLTSPPVGRKAIQSGVLRIKQASVQQYDSFWNMASKEYTKDPNLYLAFYYSLRFGRDVSGTTSQPKYENMRTIDILVKVKPYHNVTIESPELINLNPNQVAAIPIRIRNLGNYKDTIGFNIVSENHEITLVNPVDVTLKPDDIKNTILGVGVPPNLFEFGKLHKITIEAYSYQQPNVTIAKQVVILKTEGFYISEYGILLIFFLTLIILIFTLYLFSKNRGKYNLYYYKPEKPWKITEEKEFLARIEKEDKQKYKETLKMMNEEYKSALLWYNSYRKSLINKSRLEIIKERKEKQKKEKKKEEKPIRTEKVQKKYKKKEQIFKKETKPIKKPSEKKFKEKSKIERVKIQSTRNQKKKRDFHKNIRDQTIQRVINKQEKQRTRIRKIGGENK